MSDSIPLRAGWTLQSSWVDQRPGAQISRPQAPTDGWFPVEVPCTVLCALVRAGVYPDPRIWPNAFRIPDSSDAFNEAHGLAQYSHLPGGRNPWRDPWWYRVELDLPAFGPWQRVWLNLDCLNYRADVWVNGEQVADRQQVVGMFQRFRLDITAQAVTGRNCVAILVYPVDHPGDPDTQLEVYGRPRDFIKEICRDVTEVMAVGYDCFPTVPDRNMGLVQEVRVDVTGPVDLRHPFARCELDLPQLNPARVTVSAELVNTGAAAVRGSLEGTIIAPDGAAVGGFAWPVVLQSHETRLVTVGPADAPGLEMHDPQLWWPNTYGAQPLYRLELRFVSQGETWARAETPFGIRRVERELYELDGAHGFRLRVNGELIFQRGGYIQPEMMFDWDPGRCEAELRYLAHANLNYVVFEDIPNPPDWYLDLCDRLGLMFWTCFYDCYWLQYNRPWDVDMQVLEACTVDIVKRYRNHPCLVVHMAQNEGETQQNVYEMWRRTVLQHDDTRILIPSGSFPDYRTDVPGWFARELPVGCNDYAPKSYGWQMPQVYFELVREHRNWMFMIESGAASVPPLESLLRFMPHLAALGPNPGTDPRWPLDEAWAHYGANSYYEWFDRGLRLLYGEPRDVGDYVRKAHLVSYDQHRAMFEAVHHRMWEITSGFGEWKLNSAFPDVQWQIYDWFLRPMVSLYAIRKACARLAVQLCPLDGTVAVVNNDLRGTATLTVEAWIVGRDLAILHRQSARVEVAGNSVREAMQIPLPGSVAETPLYFVKLQAHDENGKLVADNFYWLSPRLWDCERVFTGDMRDFPAAGPLLVPRDPPCLRELADLPPAAVTVSAVREGGSIRVDVTNPGGELAFFTRVRLLRVADGEEVLPVYWSDNYLSLLPGESRQLVAQVPGLSADLQVAVDGWNVTPLRTEVG